MNPFQLATMLFAMTTAARMNQQDTRRMGEALRASARVHASAGGHKSLTKCHCSRPPKITRRIPDERMTTEKIMMMKKAA